MKNIQELDKTIMNVLHKSGKFPARNFYEIHEHETTLVVFKNLEMEIQDKIQSAIPTSVDIIKDYR